MPNPTPASNWVPIIDISRHQGIVNFHVMRAKGIPGVIMRATHGKTQDDKVVQYYRDALAAGYDKQDIGFYTFINPKRGSGAETAKATADFIKSFRGDLDSVLYMLDVENYQNEPPLVGTSPVTGQAFSKYLRDHMASFKTQSPTSYIMAYSNRAYWDSNLGPRDPELASELDWIVPRYPAYSLIAYQNNPLPTNPVQWDEWAWRTKPQGPIYPVGSEWQGWQFSAGYNRQGPVYGCQSSDLDLNIVTREAWDRWTQKKPDIPEIPDPVLPPIGDEMNNFVPHDGVRIYDSRTGSGVKVGPNKAVRISPATNTPVGAAVVLGITAVLPEAVGHLQVWSGDGSPPNISQVNYSPDDASPKNGFAIVPVDDDGTFSVWSLAKTHVIVDQFGYIEERADIDIDIDIDALAESVVDIVVERLENG